MEGDNADVELDLVRLQVRTTVFYVASLMMPLRMETSKNESIDADSR
jgi:hypothetical protein